MKWLAVAALAFSALPVWADNSTQNPESIMVVLDASGSMWGQIDGERKISIVQDAYGGLVTDWERDGIQSGLVVYGHRRKGDCNDIELMSLPGQTDAVSLGRTVAKLNPKGKTPLGAAVRQAAESLRYTEEKATVVLLSDGLETCGVDTCQLARDLETLGVDFTAHVIGLGLKQKEKEELQCLATQTGGQFLTAQNAGELKDAFAQTAARPQLTFQGLLADTGEAIPNVTWRLSDSDRIALATKSTDGSTLAADELFDGNALDGQYTITASSGDYAGSTSFGIPAAETTIYVRLYPDVPSTTLTFENPVETGSRFEVAWVGRGGENDQISIVPAGETWDAASDLTYTRDGNPAVLKAPGKAGAYELLYLNNDAELQREDVRVPIEIVNADYALQPVGEIMSGMPFTVQWRGPGERGDMIAIGPRTSGTDDYSSLQWIGEDNLVRLNAPQKPGDYELRYFGDGYELQFVQFVTVQ